jgi:hypothetical protein
VFLIVSAIGFVIQNINVFRGLEAPHKRSVESEIL